MSSKIIRSRGRPAVDSERVDVRFQRRHLEAIDAFAVDAQVNPDAPIGRPEAIRRIVRDWLIGRGYLRLDTGGQD